MEELFKNIKLEGVYKEAFEEAKDIFATNEEEVEVLEVVVGIVHLIVDVEKLPLQKEIEILKQELQDRIAEARTLKAKVNALEEENKRLTIENKNLLGSLKAMKELSVAEDKIENTQVDGGSKLGPTFLKFVKYLNNNRR